MCSKVEIYFHKYKTPVVCSLCVIFLLVRTDSLYNSFAQPSNSSPRYWGTHNAMQVCCCSDEHGYTRFLLCICDGGGLGWWLLATVAPHYVRGCRTNCHQRRAGQTNRLQETNEHRRNRDYRRSKNSGYNTHVGKRQNKMLL